MHSNRRSSQSCPRTHNNSLQMDEAARKWMYKTAYLNKWRIPLWMDVSDLISEGHMCYNKVLNKYGKVKDRPHLMALFKVVYTNRIHDIAKMRKVEEFEIRMARLSKETEAFIMEESSYAICDLQALMMKLPELSEPIRRLLAVIEKQPELLRKRYRHSKRHGRETTNERLCRLIGMDPSQVDLHSQLVEALHV